MEQGGSDAARFFASFGFCGFIGFIGFFGKLVRWVAFFGFPKVLQVCSKNLMVFLRFYKHLDGFPTASQALGWGLMVFRRFHAVQACLPGLPFALE